MRNFKKYGLDNQGKSSGKVKCICPVCNHTRSHPGDKSVALNLDNGLWYCHHCGAKGYVPDDAEEREREEKHLRIQQAMKERKINKSPRPAWHPEYLSLPASIAEYLTVTRGLTPETLHSMRVTGQYIQMPGDTQPSMVMGFNYFEQDTLVNVKYRTLDKRFMMVRGAELIPYNINAIYGSETCIITEGEIDALSIHQAGYPQVISVPNGGKGNLIWMDRFVETHFEDKKTIVLALDEDTVGLQLRHELIRRLGAERCRIVQWSDDCKDANDELVHHGAESLKRCINSAKEIPLEGVFTAEHLSVELRALFENGMQRGADTGWPNFDKICSFEPGRFMVVTGRPGEGKSEFIDELALRLCLRHEWKIAYFSPENIPMVYHLRKLYEKLTGFPFERGGRMNEALYAGVQRWLTDNVSQILPPDESYTLDVILEKGRQLVARKGVRILIIDPLNRIEQQLESGQTELQYISSVLNRLVRFAIQHRCLVILVAHPRKVNRNTIDGRTRRVEMNDINGSADFGNKADYCFVVDRDDERHLTTVYVDKIRFKHLGNRGRATFFYDVQCGRYLPCDETPEIKQVSDEHSTLLPAHIRWQNIRWVNEEGQSILLSEEEKLLKAEKKENPTLF